MKNKSLTPQIRFKGYDDEWQYKPLVSIANIYGGLTYSPTNVREHGTFVLRSSNVKNGQVINADNVYVETEIVNVQNVEVGDIIMVVRNGSKALIGKHAPVIKTMPNTVIGAFMSGIRTSQPFFFNALFDTNSFSAEVDKNSGATINQITGGMFKQMGFMVPSDEEQAWIGNFFEKLQQSYTDIEREITRLEKMKQASLQKMFPRPGETTPEIRFDGFTEPWKEYLMSDIASFSRGQGYTKSDLREAGTQIFLYGRLYTKYSTYVDKVDTYSFLTSFSVVSKGNEVVMPSSGETAEDIAVASAIMTEGIILSGGLNIIIPKKNIDPLFLALSLTYSEPHYELAKKAQGKSVVHIYNQDISTLKIMLPTTIQEQSIISGYFRNLDAIISAKRKKLEKLQNLKQSCLDKMFVNTTAQ